MIAPEDKKSWFEALRENVKRSKEMATLGVPKIPEEKEDKSLSHLKIATG